ncbi:hypothetical protein LEP1GSC050_3279 [Leptospira broomii serovar Hurstbridge str. 5399]|uniref:Uncharacterized protein n=1 Tax=Leptospira broomii serovar Hurstbridge str. 5399 TaxID=1049789 RepID=T0FA06_9LEPT|nr:hypothetical protein LEP1GSC050_3279 [Leptospira broomii serovar Hurstbridge str. 5399]
MLLRYSNFSEGFALDFDHNRPFYGPYWETVISLTVSGMPTRRIPEAYREILHPI